MLLRMLFLVAAFLEKAHPDFFLEKTCYRRIITGKRLHERFIRHSLPCNSLEACQHQCSIEKLFDCQGFNIRLDPARVGRGVCELTSISIHFLDLSRDFVFDPEFAYYERDHGNESPNCGHVNRLFGGVPQQSSGYGTEKNVAASGGPYYGGDSYGPWSTGHGTVDHGPWGSHGYGGGFYESNNPQRGPAPTFGPITPLPTYSNNRIGNKQGQNHGFDSEKFPDRDVQRPSGSAFGTRNDPGKNDKHTPRRIPTYIIIDADANGRGYGNSQHDFLPSGPNLNYLPPRPPPIHGPQSPHNKPSVSFSPLLPRTVPGSFHNTINQEICFRREHVGYRLDPSTIRGTYDTPTVLDCENICTESPFECTGYSYRYADSNNKGPNCLITDRVSLNQKVHLLPDRSCDVYFKMDACTSSERFEEAECFLRVAGTRKIDLNKVALRTSVSSMSDCELACLNARFFTCRTFSFRYGPPVIGEPMENCFLSDWPISALRIPDLLFAPRHEVYERGSFGHGCELSSHPPSIGPRPSYKPNLNVPQLKVQWEVDETWRHFTVNGWPCRAGTQCRLNSEGGFWGCEVEGGDRAQWDYCCRPKHSCGFSKGYKYPWCYVGEAGPEQWRPCSEFYFPDFGNRYSYRPANSQKPHPADPHGPFTETRPWDFGQEDYGPPSHWPISYLHADSPPNETTVWNPLEFHFFENQENHVRDFHQANYEDEPLIKFKSCGPKTPYPRAIVQKLDMKTTPLVEGPEEQLRKDEKSRSPKNAEFSTKASASTNAPASFQNTDEENSEAGTLASALLTSDRFADDTASRPSQGEKGDFKLEQSQVNKTEGAMEVPEDIILKRKSTTTEKPETNETLVRSNDFNFGKGNRFSLTNSRFSL